MVWPPLLRESSWRIAEVFLVKYDHDSSMVQYKSEREKERYRLTFENLNVLCFICLVHVPNVMIFSVFFPFRTRSPLSDTYYPVLSCYHAKFNFITVITKKCWYDSFFYALLHSYFVLLTFLSCDWILNQSQEEYLVTWSKTEQIEVNKKLNN